VAFYGDAGAIYSEVEEESEIRKWKLEDGILAIPYPIRKRVSF
jgi:hypothetical protein